MSGVYSIAAIPTLYVGPGALERLVPYLKARGVRSLLLCIGSSSFAKSGRLKQLEGQIHAAGIEFHLEHTTGEPSPAHIDIICETYWKQEAITAVAGIGGGSVIDTAKAVSAMIAESRTCSRSVKIADYLEGIGSKHPEGERLLLAAVPTTSGTGSEATKNAVISQVGEKGYKRSLRHDAYIPDIAILDGELSTGCPESVTAASGLDAATQLLEAYLSTEASEFTDMVALEGLKVTGKVLPSLVDGSRAADPLARTQMAYAAYLSGIALANANLGVVHGAASVLGGYLPIGHGVVCGTLLYESTRMIIESLRAEESEHSARVLDKCAKAGFVLSGSVCGSVDEGIALLLGTLSRWQDEFRIPRLASYGFDEATLTRLSSQVGLKKTPVSLTPEQIARLLNSRL